MLTVGYAYNDYWRLKNITHNGFDYEFTYDNRGNVTPDLFQRPYSL